MAQSSNGMLIPFEKDGLWGYVNPEKEVVVQMIYEAAYPSYNRWGRVGQKGKYGFIDEHGKLVIRCKYEEATDFVYGFSRVKRKGKEFFIKTDGKKNKVSIGVCGNHSGCFYPELRSELIYKAESGKYGFIVKRRITDPNKESPFVHDTIPAQFDRIFPVTHQLMLIEQNGKLSFIDKSDFRAGADEVLKRLDFVYDDYQLFNCFWCNSGTNRFLGIKQNGLWGVIDSSIRRKIIVAPKYYLVSALTRAYELVEYAQGKFGYIDQNGNEYFFEN